MSEINDFLDPSSSSHRPGDEAVQLTGSDLVDLLSSFVADEHSGLHPQARHDEDNDVQQLLKVMQQQKDAESGKVTDVAGDEEGDFVDDDEKQREAARETYPDSLIDFSDDDDDASDVSYESDIFEPFRNSIAQLYMFSKAIDMRAEQTYMRAIAHTNGSWLKIAYVTVKDQVFSPAFQGFGWRMLKLFAVPWMAGTARNGKRVGVALRQALKNGLSVLMFSLTGKRA
ncbi:hypothetical protein BZA70DRAFT_264858 [Myxozyma melibiosi]|uniref:Uncharacterized protein n=1 Tax=Myxozyma melibiosi TaxID=54550 RepID=A0ABR1FCL6_9ASCO